MNGLSTMSFPIAFQSRSWSHPRVREHDAATRMKNPRSPSVFRTRIGHVHPVQRLERRAGQGGDEEDEREEAELVESLGHRVRAQRAAVEAEQDRAAAPAGRR